MSYRVLIIPNFRREFKKLAKKYPSLKTDLTELINDLQKNPDQGATIGNRCYKIRMAVTSKGRGKSGGSRVITFLKTAKQEVYLLSIYDKSDQENISDKRLLELVKHIPN